MSKEVGTIVHRCLAYYYAGRDWHQGITATDIHTGPSRASTSKYGDLLACPQKYAYKYRLGLEPRTKADGRGDVEAASRTMEAYLNSWFREKIQVLAIEHEIVVPYHGTEISVRVDLICQQADRIWLMDHKTTANVNSRERGVETELGLYTQEWVFLRSGLLGQLGPWPYGGFMLNIIGYDGTSRRKIVRFDPSCEKSFNSSLHSAIDLEQQLTNTDPWHYPRWGAWHSNCLLKYGACPYRWLCRQGMERLGEYTWPDEQQPDRY